METLDDVLKKAGRDVNLQNCQLATHEAICFANKFGQPKGQDANKFGQPEGQDANKFGQPEGQDANKFGQPKGQDANKLHDSSESCTKDDYRPPIKSSKLERRVKDLENSNRDSVQRLKTKTDWEISTRTSLCDAVNNGDLLTVNRLSGTCDINQRDSSGHTPLHAAVRGRSEIDIVRRLLECPKCDVNIEDNLGYTPLHIAALYSHTEIVRCLLMRTDCIVNMPIRRGETPLHIAVKKCNIDIVRSLITRADCCVNTQDCFGETPLHKAVLNDNIQIVRVLVNRDHCNVSIQDCYGETPLHKAVLNGNIQIVRVLVNRDRCNVSIQDCYGETPLHKAISYENIETVRCLVEKGNCCVNLKDNSDNTPLHRAIIRGNLEIVRCLTEHIVCNVNIQGPGGCTPLHLAIWEGRKEIVKHLLQRTDCDVNIRDRAGETCLHAAVRDNNIEIVRGLLQRTDIKANIRDNHGTTPLHLAVFYNNIHIIQCLIVDGKCDVNITNGRELSPFSTADGLHTLHILARCQNVELFHVLIQRKVDVLTNNFNAQFQLVDTILRERDLQSLWFFIHNGIFINYLTSSGDNMLHVLARVYMDYLYADFSFLFDYGLDFNRVNNDGNTPLMVASLFINSPFIHVLAELPCDINKQNHQGHTALHLCVIGFTLIKERLNTMRVNSIVKELCAFEFFPRYVECIDILLKLGADVNMQDFGQKTVLMLACMKNDKKLLETLLIRGADVNIVDSLGRSALQYINLTNNVYDLACFNLLLSRGCRQSFNQPCLNGNTIIQNVLQFSPLWQIDQTVNFIKFLVFKNVNLQLLTSDGGEISYGQISLEEFSSQSRHELRQILYLSGGSFEQITQILHFEVEETYEASLPETLREKPRENFCLFSNNLSLADICRRVIRQNTGLAIHDRISKLLDFPDLTDFLLFKDIDSKRFSLPDQLESVIDDDYDDDYNSYDLDQENDDYENDYLLYKDYKYLNEVHSFIDPDSDLFYD